MSRGRQASASRYVKEAYPPNLKWKDTEFLYTIDTTGEVVNTPILIIPQGSGPSQRVGRKIVVRSISIRGHLRLVPAAATVGYAGICLFLVLDTQANGTYPNFLDVFTSEQAQAAHPNLENSDRFRILKTWRVALHSSAGVSGAYNRATHLVEYYRKCSIPIYYSGQVGTIDEFRSNNIFFAVGSAGSDQDDISNMYLGVRIRYTDD